MAGPWISESRVTPDLLKEAGYRYFLDWCADDRPIPFATRSGPLMLVPYPQEANDANAIVVRRMDADAFADMVVDQFDEMLRQAEGDVAGDVVRAPPPRHGATVSPEASAESFAAYRQPSRCDLGRQGREIAATAAQGHGLP